MSRCTSPFARKVGLVLGLLLLALAASAVSPLGQSVTAGYWPTVTRVLPLATTSAPPPLFVNSAGWTETKLIGVRSTDTNPLTNFQVLVELTPSTFNYAAANADGSDLRFGSTNNPTFDLSYYLESWNPGGTSRLWVKLPTIAPNGCRNIYLFYGNPMATTTTSDFATTFPNAFVSTGAMGGDTLTGNQTFDWFEVKAGHTLNIGAGQILSVTARNVIIAGTVNGAGAGYQAPGNNTNGTGPGGGGSSSNAGSAGGSYGGTGGVGGYDTGDILATVGSTYGTQTGTDIAIGSSGGSGNGASVGGNGGGALSLLAQEINIDGTVTVAGGLVISDGSGRGGGGGSGGGILVRGYNVVVAGTFNASGSNGATGTSTANDSGGGGGGGRIKFFAENTLANTATTNVNSGAGGPNGTAAPGQPGEIGTTHAASGVATFDYLQVTASASDSCCTVIMATVSGGGTICPNGTAQVLVEVNGGTAPYTVTLNNGGGTQTGISPLTFDVSPASTTTYSVQSATDANGCPVMASGSATVTVNVPPTVTNPAHQNVLQGGTATFSVTPTNATSVQWQVSTDGGMTYADIPLATGNTLTLNNVTLAMNGHRYRAVVRNACLDTAASKAALLVVHAAGAKFDDPLVCLVGGDTGIITAFITNNGAAAVNASYSATNLAPNLIGIPGSGVASVAPANFVITPTTANWTGVLQPGETVNLLFRVQFAPGLLNGAQVCFDATFVIDGNQAQQQICTILNCPAGGINPTVSAQKPGSLLVFPYYTSKAATKADTRFTVSNLGAQMAYVHLFLIDGTSCQPSDYFLCLTPGASYAGKASELDIENTGWILAIAVNQQGQPIQYNNLIGNAFVNDGEYVDTYGAEGFAARSPNVAALQGDTALLFFDGIGYDAMPNQFAVEIQSPVNAPNQRVVTVGVRGDLHASAVTGAAQIGTGLVINGNETPTGSFVGWLNGNCQAISLITSTTPRVPLGMSKLIPAGQTGTMQFRTGGGVGLLMTPRTAPMSGIRALHKIGLTTSTLRIPIFPPVC